MGGGRSAGAKSGLSGLNFNDSSFGRDDRSRRAGCPMERFKPERSMGSRASSELLTPAR